MSGDDKYMDDFDKYNIEQDKYENHAHSGKGRTKKEAEKNHHEDPSGHTRKAVQKLVNNAHKEHKPGPTTKKWSILRCVGRNTSLAFFIYIISEPFQDVTD